MKVKKSKNGTYFLKKGMTRIFKENGAPIPVTVLERVKNTILGEKSERSLCVFNGVRGRFNKPQVGLLKKSLENAPNKGFLKEIVFEDSIEQTLMNNEISLDFFQEGNFIDVSAATKGHGFQGPVKRYGFKGGRASHGCSLAHRSGGSTGMRHLPSKTIKGRRMAGHMGNKMRTQQNLLIVRLDHEFDALLVHGSVPGPKNALVFVKKAVKKCNMK